jgi:hypothetical protein
MASLDNGPSLNTSKLLVYVQKAINSKLICEGDNLVVNTITCGSRRDLRAKGLREKGRPLALIAKIVSRRSFEIRSLWRLDSEKRRRK